MLRYDEEGTARGNLLKKEKTLAAYDTDAAAAVQFLLQHPLCSGRVGCIGMCVTTAGTPCAHHNSRYSRCLGGHLAARCAMLPQGSPSDLVFCISTASAS